MSGRKQASLVSLGCGVGAVGNAVREGGRRPHRALQAVDCGVKRVDLTMGRF